MPLRWHSPGPLHQPWNQVVGDVGKSVVVGDSEGWRRRVERTSNADPLILDANAHIRNRPISALLHRLAECCQWVVICTSDRSDGVLDVCSIQTAQGSQQPFRWA